MYDVAVVGAGPAGSAAALSVLHSRPGAKVLLMDRADFPRDKSCGDGIAPHALDELARLGAAHVVADRVPIRRMRLRSPRGVEASAQLLRPNVVIPRELFDARLVEAAATCGAELVRHTVRQVQVRADSVVLDESVEARVVIGADGANGLVRRQLGVPRQRARTVAVAVRGYAAAPDGEPEQLIVMDGGDWPAYAWSFAAGDGTANVGFGMLLTSLRAADGGRDALHNRLLELLPGIEPTRLRSHHLPLSPGRPALPAGRVLLAGDAASLINPLTGEGIFYALLSGRLAGIAAVSGGDPGASYASALGRQLGRHLRHTTVLSRLTAYPRVLEAGVRAADRSPGAMDALVEIGLGRGLVTQPLVRALAGELVGSARRRLTG